MGIPAMIMFGSEVNASKKAVGNKDCFDLYSTYAILMF